MLDKMWKILEVNEKYLVTIFWLLLGHSRTFLVGSGNGATVCQGPECKKGTLLREKKSSIFIISVGSRDI